MTTKPTTNRKLCGIWGRPYIDLSPFIDTSAVRTLEPLVEKLHRDGTKIVFSGANPPYVPRLYRQREALREACCSERVNATLSRR